MHASGHRELHGVAWSGARTGMAWSICWLFILISVGSSEPGASAPITGIAIVDILHNDVVLTVKRTETRRVSDTQGIAQGRYNGNGRAAGWAVTVVTGPV